MAKIITQRQAHTFDAGLFSLNARLVNFFRGRSGFARLDPRRSLQKSGVGFIGVQHHHAHIAACMAENHLEGRVIGVALDVTGFGTDGNIRVGEVLVADYHDFERTAHPVTRLCRAAIRKPWRMGPGHKWIQP